MNRSNWTFAFAVALLCAGFSTGAVAQEHSTTQTTAKSQVASGKNRMSAKRTNTQHKMQLGKGDVRDWKAIDKNHDNLIEPEEMEAYLKQKG